MNLQSIMKQFTDTASADSTNYQSLNEKPAQLANLLPGGIAGGAMAGGLMTLFLNNKSARKFAGTAATIGGAALLGGLSYKAYKNWQEARQNKTISDEKSFTSAEIMSPDYQLAVIKAMIAAARADGHIGEVEQQRIFDAIHNMDLSTELKATIFDLLQRPIHVSEIAMGAVNLEQKTELYLVSCMIVDHDNPAEKAYLAELAEVMNLPSDLTQQLRIQAKQTMSNA